MWGYCGFSVRQGWITDLVKLSKKRKLPPAHQRPPRHHFYPVLFGFCKFDRMHIIRVLQSTPEALSGTQSLKFMLKAFYYIVCFCGSYSFTTICECFIKLLTETQQTLGQVDVSQWQRSLRWCLRSTVWFLGPFASYNSGMYSSEFSS